MKKALKQIKTAGPLAKNIRKQSFYFYIQKSKSAKSKFRDDFQTLNFVKFRLII